ncbi:MAG: hypothetical protein NVS9B10_18400 [Nevskia sp.]
MKRRLALSLLTVLALLWQGLAAASMVPAAAASSSGLSGHCRMAVMQAGGHAMVAEPPAANAPRMQDCCKALGHCACAATCSAAALPAAIGLLPLPAVPAPVAAVPVAGLAAAPPPHPFRPPIAVPI